MFHNISFQQIMPSSKSITSAVDSNNCISVSPNDLNDKIRGGALESLQDKELIAGLNADKSHLELGKSGQEMTDDYPEEDLDDAIQGSNETSELRMKVALLEKKAAESKQMLDESLASNESLLDAKNETNALKKKVALLEKKAAESNRLLEECSKNHAAEMTLATNANREALSNLEAEFNHSYIELQQEIESLKLDQDKKLVHSIPVNDDGLIETNDEISKLNIALKVKLNDFETQLKTSLVKQQEETNNNLSLQITITKLNDELASVKSQKEDSYSQMTSSNGSPAPDLVKTQLVLKSKLKEIATLQERINSITRESQGSKNNSSTLETEKYELESKTASQKVQIHHLSSIIETLQSECKKHTAQFEYLKKNQTSEFMDLLEKNVQLTSTIIDMEDMLCVSQSELRDKHIEWQELEEATKRKWWF